MKDKQTIYRMQTVLSFSWSIKKIYKMRAHVKNHRKVVSDLPGKIVPFPPPVMSVITLTSKCHNFFSIGSLSSLEMYVRQKFSLCLFS